MDGDIQAPAAGGKSRAVWYVVGGVVLLAALGWYGTGGLGGIAARSAGAGAEQNADGSMTYSNEEGSVTVGGGSMPSNWPSDVPAYSNATIQYSGSTNPQTGEAGAAIVFQTSSGVGEVVDFYRTELERNGWTITATASIAGAQTLSATKDTRTFGLYVVDAGGGQVTVTAGVEL